MIKAKKILSAIIAAALFMSITACGSTGASSSTAASSNAASNAGSSAANGKKIKIGVMQFGEFDALTNAYKGFVEGLKEAGYVDGENIAINYLSAAADTNNCPTIADTLINDKSDLILAIATPSALAIKQKTNTIPVLITAVTDPAGSGIVKSNEAPGGNITGTSDMNPVEKQVDLLAKLLPNAKTVAVMYCSSEANSKIQYELAKAALEKKGIKCVEKTISAIDEAKSAVESLKGKADAIYIPTDNTIADGMTTVAAAARQVKLPIIAGEGGMVANGAFATYGIDYTKLGKQTAKMAVEILKNGAKPANMPIGFQTEEADLTIAVNTKTAQAIGITVPQDILSKATLYSDK